jgi:hypothetical protein
VSDSALNDSRPFEWALRNEGNKEAAAGKAANASALASVNGNQNVRKTNSLQKKKL